jgi:hypothetical protein
MMTCMHEFLGKLWSMEFGTALMGALAGGAFAILGSWFQSKSSNKAATLAQAQANAKRAFDTLDQLRTLMESQTMQGRGTGESRAAWNRERRAMVGSARSAIMLLPDRYKETRSRSATLLSMLKEWQGLSPWPEYKVETRPLLSETLKYLGHFVRGSKVPEQRDMDEVIAKEVEQYQHAQMRQELEMLNRDAELHGLDEEDMERARKLSEALGIPHPPAPPGVATS